MLDSLTGNTIKTLRSAAIIEFISFGGKEIGLRAICMSVFTVPCRGGFVSGG